MSSRDPRSIMAEHGSPRSVQDLPFGPSASLPYGMLGDTSSSSTADLASIHSHATFTSHSNSSVSSSSASSIFSTESGASTFGFRGSGYGYGYGSGSGSGSSALPSVPSYAQQQRQNSHGGLDALHLGGLGASGSQSRIGLAGGSGAGAGGDTSPVLTGSASVVSTAPTSPRQSISSYNGFFPFSSSTSIGNDKGKGVDRTSNYEEDVDQGKQRRGSHPAQTQAQEWWEGVLPAGQLSERLRQASSRASPSESHSRQYLSVFSHPSPSNMNANSSNSTSAPPRSPRHRHSSPRLAPEDYLDVSDAQPPHRRPRSVRNSPSTSNRATSPHASPSFNGGSKLTTTASSGTSSNASTMSAGGTAETSRLRSHSQSGKKARAAAAAAAAAAEASLSPSIQHDERSSTGRSRMLSAEVQAASMAMQQLLDGACRGSSPERERARSEFSRSSWSEGDGDGSNASIMSAGLGITTAPGAPSVGSGSGSGSGHGSAAVGWQAGEYMPPTKSDIRKSAAIAQQHLNAKMAHQQAYDAERRARKARRKQQQHEHGHEQEQEHRVDGPEVSYNEGSDFDEALHHGEILETPTPDEAEVHDIADVVKIAEAHFQSSWTRTTSSRSIHSVSREVQDLKESNEARTPTTASAFAAPSHFGERYTAGRRSRVVSPSEDGRFLFPTSNGGAYSQASSSLYPPGSPMDSRLVTPEVSSGEEGGEGKQRKHQSTYLRRTISSHSTSSLRMSTTTAVRSEGSSEHSSPRASRMHSMSHAPPVSNRPSASTLDASRPHIAFADNQRRRTTSLHDGRTSPTAGFSSNSSHHGSPRDYASEFDRVHEDLQKARLSSRKARDSQQRLSARSAPGSRRGSFTAHGGRSLFANFSAMQSRETLADGASTSAHGQQQSRASHSFASNELQTLRSLDSAHLQLAHAGQLARTLTRQVAGPLKPVLQFGLVATISSVAFVSLLTFMMLSYVLTAWDDVGARGRSVGLAAGSARKNLESSMSWARKILSPFPAIHTEEAHRGSGPQPSTSQQQSPPRTRGPARKKSTIRSAIARVMPSMGYRSNASSDSEKDSASRSHERRRPDESKPGAPPPGPRPPLRVLIPSIFFTIFLAMGAGLISAFANYKRDKKRDEELRQWRAAHARTHSPRSSNGTATPPMPTSRRRPRREQPVGESYHL